MTLWIQTLFGNPIEIPFSPPIIRWRDVYYYLHHVHFSDKRVHQLRLFRGDSPDLSNVHEGEVLRLLITDLMAERWVSEYSVTSKNGEYRYHHSTITWLDGRWGDPYQDQTIHYRTPLTLHIVVLEKEGVNTFQVNMNLMAEQYGGRRKDPNQRNPDREIAWYSTLYDACHAFRETLNQEVGQGKEVCTESTIDHAIHLWGLYHGTQHVRHND